MDQSIVCLQRQHSTIFNHYNAIYFCGIGYHFKCVDLLISSQSIGRILQKFLYLDEQWRYQYNSFATDWFLTKFCIIKVVFTEKGPFLGCHTLPRQSAALVGITSREKGLEHEQGRRVICSLNKILQFYKYLGISTFIIN